LQRQAFGLAAFFMAIDETPFLVVLAGPTASGKTKAGITLARHFGTSIISGDSRQFFRELPIGTAAPSEEELRLVPHYFVGNKSVAEDFDVRQFMVEARSKLAELFLENRVQLVVGGSGLYIKALIEGLDNMPAGQPELRKKWEEILKTQGIETLQIRLGELDPEYAALVDIKNPQRIIRALEVCESTGKSYSSFRQNKGDALPYKVLRIGLTPEKEVLHKNINARVETMFELGLVKEVESLKAFRHKNALQTVGYTEVFDMLDGKITLDEAKEFIKTHTRQYAKRQMTWFKKDQEFQWFAPDQTDEMIKRIEAQLMA